MGYANYSLMALAFVLGLGLTLVFMIRRVKREMPAYGPDSSTPEADGSDPA